MCYVVVYIQSIVANRRGLISVLVVSRMRIRWRCSANRVKICNLADADKTALDGQTELNTMDDAAAESVRYSRCRFRHDVE
jgi:hypothetical protein